MNAVEIEEAVSRLAEQPFDAEAFPWAFLEAFGNKETTIKRLQSGATNHSDLGGVLQKNNIHLTVCPEGEVTSCLGALRESPATARHKAKFILATDGQSLEAENLVDGEVISCEFSKLPDHFGFFLALAGITTVKQIRESAFDIKATGRLNRLYIELLKDNPKWGTEDRREDMNHFMARLIFCFFAVIIFSNFAIIVIGYFAMGRITDAQFRPIIGGITLVMLAANIWRTATRGKDAPIPTQWWFAAVIGLLAGITRPFAAHVTHAAVHCAWLDVVLHVRHLACRVSEMMACRATARAAE
jgi:hypothetical protein